MSQGFKIWTATTLLIHVSSIGSICRYVTSCRHGNMGSWFWLFSDPHYIRYFGPAFMHDFNKGKIFMEYGNQVVVIHLKNSKAMRGVHTWSSLWNPGLTHLPVWKDFHFLTIRMVRENEQRWWQGGMYIPREKVKQSSWQAKFHLSKHFETEIGIRYQGNWLLRKLLASAEVRRVLGKNFVLASVDC